jgi:hypothetical protein
MWAFFSSILYVCIPWMHVCAHYTRYIINTCLFSSYYMSYNRYFLHIIYPTQFLIIFMHICKYTNAHTYLRHLRRFQFGQLWFQGVSKSLHIFVYCMHICMFVTLIPEYQQVRTRCVCVCVCLHVYVCVCVCMYVSYTAYAVRTFGTQRRVDTVKLSETDRSRYGQIKNVCMCVCMYVCVCVCVCVW